MDMISPAERVAANVRAERARADVSVSDLAAAIQMPQQTLSRKLNAITPFTLNEVYAVADALKVKPSAILPGVTDNSGVAA